RREHGQQRIKRHPGRDRNNPVPSNIIIDAQNDVSPAAQGNICRRFSLPPAARLEYLGLGMILIAGVHLGRTHRSAASVQASLKSGEIFARQRQNGQRSVTHEGPYPRATAWSWHE